MIRIIATLTVLAAIAGVFGVIVGAHVEVNHLRPLSASYVTLVPEALNTPNVITGILITYRGFDTLGEVAVLFMVAASLALLFEPPSGAASRKEPVRAAGEIVESGKQVLFPMIMAFGSYVALNGHLSAGGGFQDGAIIASGFMLLVIANPSISVNTAVLSVTESTAGLLFIILGILGIVLAGGFLDPRFLPAGNAGDFISAGAIPVISALLGLKVSAELSVIIDQFRS